MPGGWPGVNRLEAKMGREGQKGCPKSVKLCPKSAMMSMM
ncbi:hypothetical protein PARMER_04035 [Parabacteroides merdae ATCC 43184]|nr:hypothetical protein PARMER_04035 [Parabacteroides merdae ATCC 43184]